MQRVAQVLQDAGHPHGVFRLSPQQLQALTGAPCANVTVAEEGPAT